MRPPTEESVILPVGFLSELAAAESLDGVLNVAAAWMRTVVGADRSSVALLNEEGDSLSIYVLEGNTAIPLDATLGLQHTQVGRAVASRTQISIPDIRKLSFADTPRLSNAGLRSSVVTPLTSCAECYGSLNVAAEALDAFSPQHLSILEATAGLLASYIRIHSQIDRERRLARTDELTGMLSRRAVIDVLRQWLDERGPEVPVSILYADLTEFRAINDAYGHAVGDGLLRVMATRFHRALRSKDAVGRMGGDEFLVVMKPPTSEYGALSVAHRLMAVSRHPVQMGTLSLSARASMGVACSINGSTTAEALLAEADMALHHAKRSDSGVALADESVRREVDLIAAVDRDIGNAIRNDELSLHYQGVHRLDDHTMLGGEGLVRWNHPTQGPIPPPLLLERIEANGLTVEFTQWCLERVARDLSHLRSKFPEWEDKSISLNMNASQLDWEGYVEFHLATLLQYELQTSAVVVELVEHQTVTRGSRAEETLQKLGSYGVPVWLDDFGVGHNVLGYFGRFAIANLKFDRSLTVAIVDNETVRTVVAGLVRLARDLNVEVLAEGIEEQDQADVARSIGINVGQGYYLNRPMPVDELEQLIMRASRAN